MRKILSAIAVAVFAAAPAFASDKTDVMAPIHQFIDGFGKPRHIEVTGDRAYFVVPANYAFMVKGKPAKETGSLLTLALQKVAAGWRITGWAWTKGQGQPTLAS